MRNFTIMSPLLDEAGDGAGGGSQSGAGASGQQQSGTQQGTGQQSGTQQTTQQTSGQGTGQAGKTTAFTYQEDRSDWVPRHRLTETGQQNSQLKGQVEDLTRRLNLALGGDGKQSDPQQQKAEKIAEAFFNLPGMAKLKRFVEMDDQALEALLDTPNHIADSRQQEAQRWERHGSQQAEAVADRIADAIGADSLDAEQVADMRVVMRSWLEAKVIAELQQASDRYGVQAVQADQRRFSQTLKRYEDGDPKVFDDFVTRYTKNWVEPARRSATARTSNRTRPVPDGSGRQAVSSVQRPAHFKDLDERLNFGVQLLKERGVQFDK